MMTETATFSDRDLCGVMPDLERYARYLTGHSDRAKDLTQACLEKALTKRHLFQKGSNLRSWLFTMMRNLNIDSARKAVRRGYHCPVEDWHDDLQVRPAQEHVVALKETLGQLKGLRREERDVIALSVFRGWRHDRIAEHMDVSVGTVKSRLHRARAALAAA